jgi:hypothetical protein
MVSRFTNVLRVAQIVEPEALSQSGLGHAFGPTR